MKRLNSLILYFILGFFIISGTVHSQDVGDPAPDFTLVTLEGNNFQLSANEGKVVFLFFFGYACPHCLSNGPNTQSGIYEVYKDSTDFVAVGVDTWDGNSDGVANYKAATGIEYTLCLNGSQLEQTFETTYDRIIIIDKDGIIRYKATANATAGVVGQASEVIATYLNTEPTGGDDPDDPDDEMTVTSVSDIESNMKVSIFPVPASNELFVESSHFGQSDYNILIFDKSGKRHFNQNYNGITGTSFSIPLVNLRNGIYFLQVITKESTMVRKFLVAK